MSSDPQPTRPAPQPAETVVEFGTEPGEARRGRRRWSATEILAGLAADRRTVPLTAAVGAVALFASLISEWQVTELDTNRFTGGTGWGSSRPLTAGITDAGALGGAYLVGLFVLAGATVLVLYGPAAGRRYARLVGLSSGGVLIALLTALASSLGDTSRVIMAVFTLDLGEMQLSYGRGLWCAFFGVAAVLLALYLAGRHEPRVARGEREDEEPPEPDAPEVWSWRRPEDDDDRPPDAPFDLTVSAAKPFTPLRDDWDKPS